MPTSKDKSSKSESSDRINLGSAQNSNRDASNSGHEVEPKLPATIPPASRQRDAQPVKRSKPVAETSTPKKKRKKNPSGTRLRPVSGQSSQRARTKSSRSSSKSKLSIRDKF